MKLEDNYGLSSLVACQLCLLIGAGEGFSQIWYQLRDADSSIRSQQQTSTLWIVIKQMLLPGLGIITEGFLIDKCGRRKTLQIVASIFILSWAFIALASDITFMYMSEVFLGFTSGMIFSVILYIAEITAPRHRATLISLVMPALSCGTLLIYLLLFLFKSETVAVLLIAYTAFILTLLKHIPESHIWYMIQNKREKAACTLLCLRNNDLDAVNEEVELIQRGLSHQQDSDSNFLSTFSRLSVWKPFVIFSCFSFFQEQSGLTMIIIDPARFFTHLGAPVVPHAHVLRIIFASILFIGSFVLIIVIHRFKKRSLLFCSGIGMSLAMSVAATSSTLGCQNCLNAATGVWIREMCTYTYVFLSMLGMVIIPRIMVCIMFPNRVRGVMTALVKVVSFLAAFAEVQLYPWIQETIGTEGVLWYFTAFSVLTTIYVMLFFPETKGKRLAELEKHFEK